MYLVYILVCADGVFYVGHTKDITQRLQAHKDGTTAAFTRDRRPVRLTYVEPQPTRGAAFRRERQIKGWTRAKKKALIQGDIDRLRLLGRCRSR